METDKDSIRHQLSVLIGFIDNISGPRHNTRERNFIDSEVCIDYRVVNYGVIPIRVSTNEV